MFFCVGARCFPDGAKSHVHVNIMPIREWRHKHVVTATAVVAAKAVSVRRGLIFVLVVYQAGLEVVHDNCGTITPSSHGPLSPHVALDTSSLSSEHREKC